MNPSKRKKLYRAGLLGGKDTLPEVVEEFKAEVFIPAGVLKVEELPAPPAEIVLEPVVEEEVLAEEVKPSKKSKK
jgi:hypothetical protein